MKTVKGWKLGRVNNTVEMPTMRVCGGDRYTAEAICGDAGVVVTICDTLDPVGSLLDGPDLCASWSDLREHGPFRSNDDGSLGDGLRLAMRELLPREVAADLGAWRNL